MRSLDLRKGSVGNINAGPGVAMKITKATGNTMSPEKYKGCMCV